MRASVGETILFINKTLLFSAVIKHDRKRKRNRVMWCDVVCVCCSIMSSSSDVKSVAIGGQVPENCSTQSLAAKIEKVLVIGWILRASKGFFMEYRHRNRRSV